MNPKIPSITNQDGSKTMSSRPPPPIANEMETRVAAPSHFLLKVESFSLLGKNEIHKYETGEFDAGGYKWRLNINFNGEKLGKDNSYISAYLAISNTASLPAHWEVNAVFSIFLLNQISGHYHYSSGTRRFITVNSEWGFPQFICKNALNDPSNGFVINDNCVFGAEVFIIRDSAVFQSLLLRDVVVPYAPDQKISKFSTLVDVWASKQFVYVDECHKWEVCLPTKRKSENEAVKHRGFRKLVLEAVKLKARFGVSHVKCNENVVVEVAMSETREASPTHILMKVESFSSLDMHGIHEIVTGEFNAGGYKWRLIICTNEDETGVDSKYISAYLAVSDTTSLPANWEVNVVFSVFLFNHISGNYHYSLGRTRRFQAMKSKWDISKLISKKVMMDPSNGFLLDDKCVFGAEVFVVEKSAVSECLSMKEATNPYKQDLKVSNFSKLVPDWTSEGFIEKCLTWLGISINDNRDRTISNSSISGRVWTSKQFIAKGLTWEVIVYPKEQGFGRRFLAIYIRLIDSKRVKATFSICLKNQINEKHVKKGFYGWYSPPNTKSFGLSQFIELSTLEDQENGFIVNDCCLLEIEILVQVIV